jgi:hypothetical protein
MLAVAIRSWYKSSGNGDHSSIVGLYTTTVVTVHMRMFNWRPDGAIRGGGGSFDGKRGKSVVKAKISTVVAPVCVG